MLVAGRRRGRGAGRTDNRSAGSLSRVVSAVLRHPVVPLGERDRPGGPVDVEVGQARPTSVRVADRREPFGLVADGAVVRHEQARSCAAFSSSVMRARRSAARSSTGRCASSYGVELAELRRSGRGMPAPSTSTRRAGSGPALGVGPGSPLSGRLVRVAGDGRSGRASWPARPWTQPQRPTHSRTSRESTAPRPRRWVARRAVARCWPSLCDRLDHVVEPEAAEASAAPREVKGTPSRRHRVPVGSAPGRRTRSGRARELAVGSCTSIVEA